MFSVCRPLLRSVAVRNTSPSFRPAPLLSKLSTTSTSSSFTPPLGRLGLLSTAKSHNHLKQPTQIIRVPIRTVASTVSNKPGSQTLEHAATNVKEELGNSAADLAKVIAGANVTTDSVSDAKGDSFIGITTKIASQVPEPIFALGLVGGVPYVGASAMTVWLAYEAQKAASGVAVGIDPGIALNIFDQALNFQVTYGAVMLSFLGALHWGMEMAGYGGQKGYPRLVLGVAPMLVAWPTLAMEPLTALAVQWMGFTGLWYADSKATMAGWAPKWYSQYRFYLSILVGTCIIGSLAGTSFFGPVAGHGFLNHELEYLREERKAHMPVRQGIIKGPIEAVPAGPDADKFTRIHKREVKEDH